MDASNYRKSLLEQPQGEIALADLTRNFSHWFFDLLRNFVLVGGLRYFAEKSGSTILWVLHGIALFVILLVEALRGEPLLAPGSLTLGLLVVWAVSTTAALFSVSRRHGSAMPGFSAYVGA